MYIWEIKLLKKQLSDEGLPDGHLILYITLYIGLGALGMEFMGYFPYEAPNIWNYVGSGLNIAIPVLGTLVVYYANGGSGGADFAGKYFSIGFVSTIRFLVLLAPIMMGLMVYWNYLPVEDEARPTAPLEVIVFAAWYMGLYLYIARQVRDTVIE